MLQIELETEQKVEMLHEILSSYLSDLRMEIAATDLKDFRDQLKEREVFLRELLEKLNH